MFKVKRYPWAVSYGNKFVDCTVDWTRSLIGRQVHISTPQNSDPESGKSVLVHIIKVCNKGKKKKNIHTSRKSFQTGSDAAWLEGSDVCRHIFDERPPKFPTQNEWPVFHFPHALKSLGRNFRMTLKPCRKSVWSNKVVDLCLVSDRSKLLSGPSGLFGGESSKQYRGLRRYQKKKCWRLRNIKVQNFK